MTGNKSNPLRQVDYWRLWSSTYTLASLMPLTVWSFLSPSGQSNRFNSNALIIMQKTKIHISTRMPAITVPTILMPFEPRDLPIACVAVTWAESESLHWCFCRTYKRSIRKDEGIPIRRTISTTTYRWCVVVSKTKELTLTMSYWNEFDA